MQIIITFRSLLAANDPALGQSQVLPKLRLGSHKRETQHQHEEEVHVELRNRTGDSLKVTDDVFYLISCTSLTLSFYVITVSYV